MNTDVLMEIEKLRRAGIADYPPLQWRAMARATKEDWKVMSRVAADSAPVWIHRMIRYLSEPPDAGEEPAAASPEIRVTVA